MEFTKLYKGYILYDPLVPEIPRYVGITKQTVKRRFAGHLSDIYNRPELNSHKTNWFKKLLKGGRLPVIKQIEEFDSLEEAKQFEVDYIAKHKTEYKLINQTKGGDYLGFKAHSRESILKKKATRAVSQYNVLGEHIADYEIMEDIKRTLNLREKACSHITQCCKGTRKHAYGYIWRYKGDPLGDLSNIDPKSLYFNKLVQYDLEGNRLAEYDSYAKASLAIGDKSKGGNISNVVKGIQKTCKNFYFQIEPLYVYFDQNLFDKINKQDRTIHRGNKSGKIIQVINSSGVIQEFTSYSEAALTLGKYSWREKIRECCKGIRKEWQGYKFKEIGPL